MDSESSTSRQIIDLCTTSLYHAHQSWFFIIKQLQVFPERWKNVKHLIYQDRGTHIVGLVTFFNKLKHETLVKRHPDVITWINRGCPHHVAMAFIKNDDFQTREYGTMCPRLVRANAIHLGTPGYGYDITNPDLLCHETFKALVECPDGSQSSSSQDDTDIEEEDFSDYDPVAEKGLVPMRERDRPPLQETTGAFSPPQGVGSAANPPYHDRYPSETTPRICFDATTPISSFFAPSPAFP